MWKADEPENAEPESENAKTGKAESDDLRIIIGQK